METEPETGPSARRRERHRLQKEAKARRPHLPDEIIGLIFELFVAPAPTPHQSKDIPHVGSVATDWRRLRDLRNLCLSCKRFDAEARPRLYRHIVLPKRFYDDLDFRSDSQMLTRLDWSLFNSGVGETLASHVRSLHLRWIAGEGAQKMADLIAACPNLAMLGLRFIHTSESPTGSESGVQDLHISIAALKHLTIFECNTTEVEPIWEAHYIRQTCPRSLPSLAALSLEHREPPPLTEYTIGTMPNLRHLRVYFYDLLSPAGNDVPSRPLQDATRMSLQAYLQAICESAPNLKYMSLRISTPGLSLQDFHPHGYCNGVEHLSIGASFSSVMDLRQWGDSAFPSLTSLVCDARLCTGSLESIPGAVAKLEMEVGNTEEIRSVARFLATPKTLPLLRDLSIDYDATTWIREALADHDLRTQLRRAWLLLVEASKARRICLHSTDMEDIFESANLFSEL